MGGKIGSSIRATKKASGFVVSSSSFLGGLEGPEPHSYLLCRVFDLCHPLAGRPLSHPDKLASAIIVGSPLFVFALLVG